MSTSSSLRNNVHGRNTSGTAITIFSSIPDVAASLRSFLPTEFQSPSQSRAPEIHEIRDKALTGYGGTVEFQPQLLSLETRLQLKEARILVTEPSVLAALLRQDPGAIPNVEWCQSTYAGVDPIFRELGKDLRASLKFQLTRFAGKFGPPIAEWVAARMIAHERQFDLTRIDQAKKEWVGDKSVTTYRYMSDLTLVILGCGDIGLCIARLGKALGMRTLGYVRSTRAMPPNLDECTTDITYALKQADYVVSVLPSTPNTRGFLNDKFHEASIGKGGKSPVFLNVGRGDVIDEANLIDALDKENMSAAILDVFPVEPLPKSSPLWTHPKVSVSPHVSGVTRAVDVPDLVWKNYQLYMQRKPLLFTVDFNKGY